MAMKITSFVIAFLLTAFSPIGAFAFQHENHPYLPLRETETGKRFPVNFVGTLGNSRPGYFQEMQDKPLPKDINVGVSGAAVTKTSDDGLLISGKDKEDQNWSVNLGDFVYAGRFYVADLDRNKIRDLVLIFPTGGNGLAPTSHIFILTFDERGRPIPFQADGYFQESEEGIFDLVDSDKDGHAELIYMNFSGGYWITSLYEVRNARWRRIEGLHGKRVFPLYTKSNLTRLGHLI